ncbi:MAG: hypothetical protein AB1916_05630 [Thermodesulfobacteriota bacterium]
MRDFNEMMELANVMLNSPGRPVDENGERLLTHEEVAFIMGVTPNKVAQLIEDNFKNEAEMRENGIYPWPGSITPGDNREQ